MKIRVNTLAAFAVACTVAAGAAYGGAASGAHIEPHEGPSSVPHAYAHCLSQAMHRKVAQDVCEPLLFGNSPIDTANGWEDATSWGYPNCGVFIDDTSIIVCPNGMVETS